MGVRARRKKESKNRTREAIGRAVAKIAYDEGGRASRYAIEKSTELLETLSPAEREIAIDILKEMQENPDGKSFRLDRLWDSDYARKPVEIDEFLDSDEFLGAITKQLYEPWREELREVFRPGSEVYEWIFRGAIGTGKSTVAAIAKAFLIYRNSCLRNIHEYYGLMKNSRIVFGVYSVTVSQVHDVGYFKVRNMIEECPYFTKVFPWNHRLLTRVDFTRGAMQVIAGSRAFHSLGLDLLSLYLDEANFHGNSAAGQIHDTAETPSQAMEIYNATKTRLKSRFMRPGGLVPGMMFLISSERGKQDFLPQHIEKISSEIKAGKVKVSNFSQWAVKPVSMFCGDTFKVQIGDQIHPSRILAGEEYPAQGCELLRVPVEFKPDFEADVDRSIRDIAGIATSGIAPFFRDKTAILECIDRTRRHPFTRPSVTIDYKTDVHLQDFFVPEEVFQVRNSMYIPRIHPLAPRFIHVDLGLTNDCAAICIGHSGPMRKEKRFRHDGGHYLDSVPSIYIDMMLQIRPPYQSEIDLEKVRSFIINLRDHGIPIARVSFDGFQSIDSKQTLIKLGFDAVILSVDKTEEAYMYVRQAVLERRLSMYDYPVVLKELFNLERDLSKHKIDHPQKNEDGTPGSKDVSDALAGVCFHCMTDIRARDYEETLDMPVALVGESTARVDPRKSGIPIQGGTLNWADLERE